MCFIVHTYLHVKTLFSLESSGGQWFNQFGSSRGYEAEDVDDGGTGLNLHGYDLTVRLIGATITSALPVRLIAHGYF